MQFLLFFIFLYFSFWRFLCKIFNSINFFKKNVLIECFFFQKCRFLHKVFNKNCNFCCFFIFLYFSFWRFLCKFFNSINFFLKKNVLIEYFFIQKCRFLHKVFNKKCNCCCFLFSIFQFLIFLSKFFNWFIYIEKKCCFMNTFFQKCRFLHIVFNKKCELWCFLHFCYSIFQFLKFFSCKKFNLFVSFKKIMFY